MSKLWPRTGLALAVLAASVVPVLAWPASPRPAPVAFIAEAGEGGEALAAARRQGTDVVVTSMTTENRLVKALPDGTMSAELAAVPVRTARDGRWVDIDTTLVLRADGSVGPRAATANMTFSGGGANQPMVKLAAAGGWVALSWPGGLPAPTLDGSVATYANVLPGVDLKLRAEGTGYTKHVVVRTPEAAKNPALRNIRFGLTSHLLTLTGTADGGTEIRDPAGQVVFAGPPSLMWDNGQPQGRGAPEGAKTAPVEMTLESGALSLVPPKGFLDDPDVRYPVVIDPGEHTPGRHNWALVFSGYAGNKYWWGDGDNIGKVGQCPKDWGSYCGENGGLQIARTYWGFDTSFLEGRSIVDPDQAKFTVNVTHGADCVSRNHTLHKASKDIWDGMTWNTQPGGYAVSTRGVGCAGDVVFALGGNVNLGGMTSYWIQADDERTLKDPSQRFWRKYNPDSARFYVKFNAAPNWPNDVRIAEGLPAPCRWCEGKSYVGVNRLTLQALLTDKDNDAVRPYWDIYDPVKVEVRNSGPLGSGNWHSYSLDLSGRDGREIDWYVKAVDSANAESEWRHGIAPFRVDLTGVPNKPVVTSKAYPADGRWHGGAGVPGDFTFEPAGITDIDHYLYDWTSPPKTKVDADSLGGPAAKLLLPPGDGPRDLFVRSVDKAGHESPITTHRIYVRAGNGPLAQWSMEGDTKDSAFLGWRDGSLLGGASYVPGAVGTGVSLDGATGRVAVSNGVRTDTSFSVSAWAKLDRLDSATVVAQSGSVNSGFAIQYEAWTDRWVFVLPRTDEAAPPADFVRSPLPPVAGAWTHLAGVYDAQQGRIFFYVDGVLAGSAPRNTPWNAAGYFRIGYQDLSGFTRFFPGTIDEVKMYDRPVSAAEVRAEVSRDNVQLGYWKFDDDAQSKTAVNTVPGGASGVLNGGAKFVAGQVNGAVELNGSNDFVTTGAPVLRTDQSFTVAGWLTATQLPSGTNTHTAVSQSGTVNSGFFLGYRNIDGGRWELYMPSADAVTRPADSFVQSGPGTAIIGRPTHVAAVYDGATQQMRLYVDGQPTGAAARTGGFNANGPLRIGGGLAHGGLVNPWHGTVDELRAYSRVLSVEELQGLVSRDAVAMARWSFDGNLAADPASFTGRGTVDYTGGQSTLPEPNDLAVKLNGANHVTASHIDNTKSFSLAVWARLDKAGGHATVISQDGNRICPFQLHATPFVENRPGNWALSVFGNDNEADPRDVRLIGPTVQIGVWTHLAATYNAVSKRAELYINGVPAGYADNVTPYSYDAGELQFGATKWAGARQDYFTGAIDDASVWSRPLFAEEITVMAGRDLSLVHQWQLDEAVGSSIADSVGTRTGTLTGNTSFAVGRVGNAARFDGAGDAITTAKIDVRTDKAFTVMAWVKLASAECDLSQHFQCKSVAVSVDGDAASKFRLGHIVDNDQYQWGAWFFEMPESDGTVTKASIATLEVEVNTWVHLTGVYDPATKALVVYVDAERHDEGTLNTPWQANGGLAIGRGWNGEFWNGDVDEVRVYTGALDKHRIEKLHGSYPAEDGPQTVPVADAGHWKFNENTGTTAGDSSAHGRTATFTGGAAWMGGRDTYAMWLDGTSGYAQTATAAVDTKRDFSATAWAYLTTSDGNRTVFGQDGNRVSTFQVRYDGTAKRWAAVIPSADADNTAMHSVFSAETAAVGEWTHLGLTYNATLKQLRLYVNGVLSGAQVGITIPVVSGPVSFGRSKWNGTNTGFFARGIDEVRLWQQPLSGGQIRKIHDEADDVTFQYYRFDDSTTRDYSWRNNHAVSSGGVTFADGISGKAVNLDGTGEATSTYMGVHMRDSFTVSGWVKLTRDDRVSTIVSQDGDRTSGFALQYRNGLNRWVFGQYNADSDGTQMVYASAPQAPVLNQWTHVAGVYDYPARQLRIYVDGKLAGVRDNTVLWVATGTLAVGRGKYNGAKATHFNGMLDEIRVDYGVVSDAKLTQRAGWPLPAAGQLGRFVNLAGERYTSSTNDKPKDGYRFDGALGLPAAPGPNTAMLYQCSSGADYYSSTNGSCTNAAPSGLIYTVAPSNIPTVALYSCVAGADRFDSRLPDCGGATVVGTLGYTVAYARLVRHYLDGGADHFVTVNATPPSYRYEGPQGYLALKPLPGTIAVYSCLDGVDQFLSTDATCGGKTVLGNLGALWTSAPPGVESRPLLRCAVNGQRFTSIVANCEGMTTEAQLGHIILTPPNTTAEFSS